MDTNSNNKRIAKNTLMLYFRMFLIMGVTLFSFRIILKELGEEGYGIYNVVAGVVVLFSFLSGAMTQSTQRFLSYHIGRKDYTELQRVFSMSFNVHIVIAGIILILAETVGLWFLNRYMNFPAGMVTTANIVYQCSIFTFIVQILTIPFQASIISNERMSFYAYFSILEALLKLSSAILLIFFIGNKIIIYSIALSVVSVCVFFTYRFYCRLHFEHCVYHYFFDMKLFKNIISFSGWNMLGGIGNVGATQGVNIILNIFRGVTLNAAMGVSNQVAGAVSSFVTNMQTAFNPQIIKSYAAEDKEYFLSLIFRASRFSFLLIFIIGFPVILCCSTIFDIWLTETPEYAVPFTQLIIAFCMIDAISGPLWTAAQACGKIKTYMIIIATMIFTNVPAAYIILYLGLSPVWLMVYKVAMNLLIHFTRIGYLHWLICFPSFTYLRKVMLPIILYIMIAAPLPFLISQQAETLFQNLLLITFTVCECTVVGLFIMMSSNERRFVMDKIRSILHLA
ncbi:MAG: lipopolysaccharide biosynthesis protein [Muribaculaceae bacterium]|nr:lipopolysaccharide biosynthesis protein [Muribaculaceae bacterium]